MCIYLFDAFLLQFSRMVVYGVRDDAAAEQAVPGEPRGRTEPYLRGRDTSIIPVYASGGPPPPSTEDAATTDTD